MSRDMTTSVKEAFKRCKGHKAYAFHSCVKDYAPQYKIPGRVKEKTMKLPETIPGRAVTRSGGRTGAVADAQELSSINIPSRIEPHKQFGTTMYDVKVKSSDFNRADKHLEAL